MHMSCGVLQYECMAHHSISEFRCNLQWMALHCAVVHLLSCVVSKCILHGPIRMNTVSDALMDTISTFEWMWIPWVEHYVPKDVDWSLLALWSRWLAPMILLSGRHLLLGFIPTPVPMPSYQHVICYSFFPCWPFVWPVVHYNTLIKPIAYGHMLTNPLPGKQAGMDETLCSTILPLSCTCTSLLCTKESLCQTQALLGKGMYLYVFMLYTYLSWTVCKTIYSCISSSLGNVLSNLPQ